MASTNVIIKTTGGKIEILAAAAITNEDCRTFEVIFDFIFKMCPQLSTIAFVLLVDGDRAHGWLQEISFSRFVTIHFNGIQSYSKA
jgi:hypothetical protein